MKLLLTSNGFVNDAIVDACVQLVGKSASKISFAVINEAYAVEHEDHRWLIDDLQRLQTRFGGRIELVNLLANDIKTITERCSAADALFVTGGYTDYLMSVYQKSGFADALPSLLKEKVYVGVSAGSIVCGKRLDQSAYQIMYGLEPAYGTTSYLELVDFSVLPHIDSPDFPGRRQKVLQATKHQAGTTYALNDDSAVVVQDSHVHIIGSGNLGDYPLTASRLV